VKRPSDRKSVVVVVRLTKAERAALNKQRQPHESLSDVIRRLLFAARSSTAPEAK